MQQRKGVATRFRLHLSLKYDLPVARDSVPFWCHLDHDDKFLWSIRWLPIRRQSLEDIFSKLCDDDSNRRFGTSSNSDNWGCPVRSE